jgi:hypothetical protein
MGGDWQIAPNHAAGQTTGIMSGREAIYFYHCSHANGYSDGRRLPPLGVFPPRNHHGRRQRVVRVCVIVSQSWVVRGRGRGPPHTIVVL